jgi:PKD repeat protein
MMKLHVLLSALCALAISPTLGAQLAHVIPNGTATTEGSGASSYPWNRTSGEIRVMYIYDSSHFTDAGINQPILINSLKGRANGSNTATWTGGAYLGMTIDMGTSVNDWMAASVTFDNNYTLDRTQVFQGNAVVKPSPATGGAIPQPEFFAETTFQNSFLYDPSAGLDLIIDFVIPTGSWGGGTSYSVDLVYTAAATPPALGCRFWNLTASAPTASNATPQLHSAHVVELGYTPAKGLYPNFTADTTVGPEGLTVNFRDTSYTSDPGGILARTWDFGDGGNSSSANPSHKYSCGVFDVTLTVIDATGTKSVTKTGYIRTGQITCDFSTSITSGYAPLSVTFTDLSKGSPNAWAWDFGDGTSSSAQNPTHVYATNGSYSVTLYAKTTCHNNFIRKDHLIYVGGGRLETLWIGGNGLSANNCGNLFDVKIKNPRGLKITSFDVSLRSVRSSNAAMEVWICSGTYLGNDNLPDRWVLAATGTGVSSGALAGDRTYIDTSDFFLPPGDYGMYIIQNTGGIHYTDGTGTNQTYSDAHMELTLGVGKNLKFSGSVFNPRVWNGAIYFDKDDAASNGPFGRGCIGSNTAIPTMSLSSEPVLGQATTIEVTGMTRTSGMGWMFIGLTDLTGMDLTNMGMTDCRLHANPIALTFAIANNSGNASVPATIPRSPSLAGSFIALQVACVDTGANPLGVAATAGHAVRLGY